MSLHPILGRDEPLPTQRGLFGTKLRVPSIVNLHADQQREGGGFKFFSEQDYNPHEWGWPYDYSGDLEYKWAIGHITGKIKGRFDSNLAFLTALKSKKLTLLPEFLTSPSIFLSSGPMMAPEPEVRDPVGYVWPSYIIWPNDPSYLSFLGSPESMELPKHVLRQTRGHLEYRDGPSLSPRPRFHHQWNI